MIKRQVIMRQCLVDIPSTVGGSNAPLRWLPPFIKPKQTVCSWYCQVKACPRYDRQDTLPAFQES